MGNDIKLKNRQKCPLCGSESNKNSILYFESWELVECSECSFVFMPVVPVYEMMKEEFAWEKNFAPSKDIKIVKKDQKINKKFNKKK